jgi:hypothetical protein
VSRQALLEPVAGTEMSLEQWAALPEDERLEELWAAVDRLAAPQAEG